MRNSILINFIYILSFSISSGQTLWEQTNGPCSGQLTSITKDSKGYLYTITLNKYLFRSKDNGETWQKIAADIPAIAFDADNNYYLGSNDGTISLFDTNMKFIKIFREPGFGEMNVENISVDAKGNVYTKIFWGGLHVTTDKGITWKEIYEDNFSQISFDSNNVIIKTHYGGTIDRSTNYGSDWTYIKINDASFKQGIFSAAYNKIFNNFIAVGMGNVVYISSDLGITWYQGKDSIPISYVVALTVDDNGDVYIGGDGLVCRSTDGGNSWNKLDEFPKVNAQSLINKDDFLFCSTSSNGIVCYNKITKASKEKNQGIINSTINQLSINKNGNVFAATVSGIYRTTNTGINWEQLVLPKGSIENCASILCSKSGLIYASNVYGLIISSDEGNSWTQINTSDSINEGNLTLAESENGRIYAGNQYLYYSDDNGITWQYKDLNVYNITSIATYQNDFVLVASYNEGVFYSEDMCNTFTKLNIEVPENYGAFVALNHKGELFVSLNAWFGGGVTFRSVDRGKTFTILPNSDMSVSYLRIDNDNNIYLTSEGGSEIIFSKDNGDSWKTLKNETLKSIYVSDICFGENNNAYLGTLYDGVYKTENLVEVNDNNIINPIDLTISPNPAYEIICISFKDGLHIESGFYLSIFNSLGIEMNFNPSEGLKPSEGLRYCLSIADFPIGIYYCTLSIGTHRIAKSFVVVR